MSGWLGAVNYGVIVANDVDAYPDEQRPRRDHEPATNPRRHSRTAIRSCWSTRSSSGRDSRIVCRKTFSRRRGLLRRPLSRAIRSCRACCCAKRPCRPARSCSSRHLAEAGGRVPVATRMNDVRFKRMVRPGETIRMEVELIERLADAFFLKAKVDRRRQDWPSASSSPARRRRPNRRTSIALVRTMHDPMDFLQLAGKTILIFGVANRKSVAYHIGRVLDEAGAKCVYVVQIERRRGVGRQARSATPRSTSATSSTRTRSPGCARNSAARHERFHGLVHSIAFADYSDGMKPFHETPQAGRSCRRSTSPAISLIALCQRA